MYDVWKSGCCELKELNCEINTMVWGYWGFGD